MQLKFNNIEELTTALKQGEMIVLCDDKERENEGDIVMAAEKAAAWHINFMATEARGLICIALTPNRCRELNLSLMVDNKNNNSEHGTNFTVSVDAKEGISTGISAEDRARTIQTIVDSNTTPYELVRPGHIFPIMAHPQGVLGRAGHTEAATELAALAGLMPAAVIVEIMNPDGTMARDVQLQEFAAMFNLKIGTIEDLISYKKLEKTRENR